MAIGKNDPFRARRLILECKKDQVVPFRDRLAAQFVKEPEFKEFSPDIIAKMYDGFWDHLPAQGYMYERGFTEETLRHFKIGYSKAKNLIAVPMHDPKGMPVGVIGRTIIDKRFRNSDKLPTSKTLWNFHRAKRSGGTVIINEASFDSMRVHQAGYPNVVACLGGNFNDHHSQLLDRTFSTIIIMSDFDNKKDHMYPGCKKCKRNGSNLCIGHNPGRDLGTKIVRMMQD